jgi:hypothetical protein
MEKSVEVFVFLREKVCERPCMVGGNSMEGFDFCTWILDVWLIADRFYPTTRRVPNNHVPIKQPSRSMCLLFPPFLLGFLDSCGVYSWLDSEWLTISGYNSGIQRHTYMIYLDQVKKTKRKQISGLFVMECDAV